MSKRDLGEKAEQLKPGKLYECVSSISSTVKEEEFVFVRDKKLTTWQIEINEILLLTDITVQDPHTIYMFLKQKECIPVFFHYDNVRNIDFWFEEV